MSEKIEANKHQYHKPSFLQENTMYAVQKQGFWYRVMLKIYIPSKNKGILHFLDCDGLRDVFKKGGKYEDILRITDVELEELPFGQIKLMVHGISKYDQGDQETVHYFNELLQGKYVTGLYVPLDIQPNRIHQAYVGDFLYTVNGKLRSFREVLIKEHKAEPKRVRELINVLLIRKRAEIINPDHFLSLSLITDVKESANSQQPDPVLAERYQLHLNQIAGEGAFGTVIMATDLQNNAKLAIKTFKKDDEYQTSKNDHIREVNMLKLLDRGPHIVSLVSSGETDMFGMFIVFPFIESNLYDEIYETNGLSKKQIKSIISMIFEALNFMHNKDIVHLDLKPANILVDGDGIVRLCDFGLARKTNGYKLESICGTRPYMSPEMLLSLGYTYSTDIWVSNCIFYSKFNLIFVINLNL